MKCHSCGVELSKALKYTNPEEYKRRKIENGRLSLSKARANGTKVGRRRTRNDSLVRELREKGFSMRKIAIEAKCSVGSVQRALKGIVK